MPHTHTPAAIGILIALVAAPTFGRLRWEQRQTTVEAGLSDASAAATFPFTNESDRPVTITSVTTSCGCTTAALAKETYQPGESGTIQATLTIGSRTGQQTKRIIVRTDDEQSPVTTLTMTVKIPQVLNVRPRLLHWRTDEPRQPKSVSIDVSHDAPVQLLGVRIDPILIQANPADTENNEKQPLDENRQFSAESDAFSVELREEEPGDRYRLIVTPRSDAGPVDAVVCIVTRSLETLREFRVIVRLLPDPSDDSSAAPAQASPDA